MKKLIGSAMLAALLATSAFAELSVGVWLRQLWVPVAYNGGDVKTGIQNSWGGGRTAAVGLNWVSEDERAGVSFKFVYDPWGTIQKEDYSETYVLHGLMAGLGPDGNNLIWVKPWDWLKVSLGHWDDAGGTDITTVNTASWDWVRPNIWTEHLYSENEATGALFQITPVEDLYIAVGLPFANSDLAYHMFEALTADVAYTVPDVLKVMVGWRGGRFDDGHRDNFSLEDFKDADDKFMNVGEVDVYASLLAVENLQLELGARINILNADYWKEGFNPSEPEKSFRPSALIGLKAGYNITDNFSIKADFAVVTHKKMEDVKYTPDFQFGVGIGVGLTDSLSLDADFRGYFHGDYKFDGNTVDGGDPTFSFLVGLNYACSSNAVVGIGFQGKTNGGAIGPFTYEPNGDNFGFAVPIKAQLSF